MPKPQKIMIIRHAEKPDNVSTGVLDTGTEDPESLTVRGWQRAGALVGLFAPNDSSPEPLLAKPEFIFASEIGKHSQSNRPQETVTPLSKKLRNITTLNTQFLKGDEVNLANYVLSMKTRAVLICWEHENIPTIVGQINITGTKPPDTWPRSDSGESRFDLVWIFNLVDEQSGTYSFQQFSQNLLDGDQVD